MWTFEMISQQPDLQLGISSWTPKRGCSLIQSSTEKKHLKWSSIANLEHHFTIFIPKTSSLNRALRLIFSSQKRTTFVWIMVFSSQAKGKHESVTPVLIPWRGPGCPSLLSGCALKKMWGESMYLSLYLSLCYKINGYTRWKHYQNHQNILD